MFVIKHYPSSNEHDPFNHTVYSTSQYRVERAREHSSDGDDAIWVVNFHDPYEGNFVSVRVKEGDSLFVENLKGKTIEHISP